MKVIWEAKDIRPGTVVGKSLTTERFIIAYRPNPDKAERGNLYTIVSLADGLIVHPNGLHAQELALAMNEAGRVPVEFLETKFGGERAD